MHEASIKDGYTDTHQLDNTIRMDRKYEVKTSINLDLDTVTSAN